MSVMQSLRSLARVFGGVTLLLASQAFAALTSVEGIKEFMCEFVKQAEWSKRYGAFPTYVVRRA